MYNTEQRYIRSFAKNGKCLDPHDSLDARLSTSGSGTVEESSNQRCTLEYLLTSPCLLATSPKISSSCFNVPDSKIGLPE